MVGKKLFVKITAFVAALSLIFSVLPVGSPVTEAKADDPVALEVSVVEGQEHAIFNAKLYYHFTLVDDMDPVEGDWNQRYDACVTWGMSHEPVLYNEDRDDWNWHEDTTPENYSWDWKDNDDSTFDDIFVLVRMRNWDDHTITQRLTVASSGAIQVDSIPDEGEAQEGKDAHGAWSSMEVKESAVIGGPVKFLSNEPDSIFKLYEGATLTFVDNGSFESNNSGALRVGKFAKIVKNDGSKLSVSIDGESVVFDGSQNDLEYDLYCDAEGNWTGEAAPHIMEEVVLPRDEKSFRYTLDDWYQDKSGRTVYECEDGIPRTQREADAVNAKIREDNNGNLCHVSPWFNKVTIDCQSDTYSICDTISITTLEVSEESKLKIVCGKEEDPPYKDKYTCSLDVEKAIIDGAVEIDAADAGVDDNGYPFTNGLVVKKEIHIGANGSVTKSGNGNFEIGPDGPYVIEVSNINKLKDCGYVELPGKSKLKVGSSYYQIGDVTINGDQTEWYALKYDTDSSSWKTIGVVKNVTLPADKDSFWFTAKYFWDNGDKLGEPHFESITVTDDIAIDHGWFYTDELRVNENATLTLKMGDENFEQGENIEGVWMPAYDSEGNKVYRKDNSAIIAFNAYIAGKVVLAECDTNRYEWDWVEDSTDAENGGHFEVFKTEPDSNVFEARNLYITGSGMIDASADGTELRFGFDNNDPEAYTNNFGESWKAERYFVEVPAERQIYSPNNSFRIEANTTIKVGGSVKTMTVTSGNPGDTTTTHTNFRFDESRIIDNGANFVSNTDESWDLAIVNDKGQHEPYEVWWGAPFNNEYRVYFKKGSVKIGGREYATGTFHSYTVDTPFEVELVPPADFTGTPIVFINGGYYNIDEDYMRSDDFKTSDLWWADPTAVTKLEVKDNKFTYTPKDDRGIEIYVYYDPEDIMYDAMYFVDRGYLNIGEFWGDGSYHFYPDRAYNADAGERDKYGNIIPGYTQYGLDAAWAYPGNEFMVEVTQYNSNGTVEMTPGIDFYRVGNKVKALYQGFEILGGKSVEVEFKPASGYDLLAVTIDGSSYSPLAAGMTYSGGVYTLKITETPTVKDATLNGLYPDDFRKDDYVKIKKISATFGIPSYSGGGDSGSDSGSGTSTDVGTGTGTGTDAGNVGGGSGTTSGEEEPEIQRQTTTTDKADDGTETTTTSTTYTDGSKVTEKVVEKPDGSTTSTTTTTEADGTKITEKVEEKADGSSKATTTTTETDGTKTTETVEKKADGTEVTTSTVKDADGNSTTEKVEKKTDGTVTTTNTTKDADGASTTEKVVEKPDGSVTTTSTEKDADGNVLSTSKVVEKTKEDGTKTITATEKNADGSSSTSKTTINTDGSSKTNTTTQNADGSTTKEKITEKADGSLTRTATTTDEDGNVLATEKEKVTVSKSGTETSTTTIENADGSSSESVVKTKADGSATSTLTETDADGNVSVTVGSTKKDGSEISKSYAVEDDGVVLTAVEATTASASIPATVKVNGKSVPVTTVGEGAMKDNTSVKKVTLAESITSIGEDAFSGAKNLKTIKLSANVTEIAPGAFDGIKSNATFYISAETDEEFNALVELLKKSGVGSKVKFKRA